LDPELVTDIARVLLEDEELARKWRRTWQIVARRMEESTIVSISRALPAEMPGFTGRTEEMRRIVGSIKASLATGPVAATIIIEGMAGVGKTQLAIQVGHALARHGIGDEVQLFVNLYGYDGSRPPASSATILDGFLRTLGVSSSRL